MIYGDPVDEMFVNLYREDIHLWKADDVRRVVNLYEEQTVNYAK